MKKIISAFLFFTFLVSPFYSLAQPDVLESGKQKQKSGNHADAITDFNIVIKKNEGEVQKYMKQLEEYEKIPVFERAEKGVEVPSVDTNFAMPYYLRGRSYSATGKNTDALNDFNTAIKINPKMGVAYYQRGNLLWSTGKKDEGCIDLQMAGSLGELKAKEMFDQRFCWQEAAAAYKDASAKLRMNEFQTALDKIQISLKLCPDSATYLGARGRAYLGLGKSDLAMADFERAIFLSKNSFDAWYGRGVANYNKSKWQDAFDDLSKAINLNDQYPDVFLYRAYACEGMEKNQSALYDYAQVQRMNPLSGFAYFKSGLLRNTMNDQAGACKDFRKAASLSYAEADDYADKCDKTQKKK